MIEKRWEVRFGDENIDHLRSLSALVSQLDDELPDSLPILGYGLYSIGSGPAGLGRDLSSLLSKVLLAFAMEFERNCEVSLAICANVLRLCAEEVCAPGISRAWHRYRRGDCHRAELPGKAGLCGCQTRKDDRAHR